MPSMFDSYGRPPSSYELWDAVKLAAQDDPGPLLDLAHHYETFSNWKMVFALKWCAARKLRPYQRDDVKLAPRWQWVRKQDRYPNLTKRELAKRSAAVLPRLVFDAAGKDVGLVALWDCKAAYEWLADALNNLGAVTKVPAMPPLKAKAAPVPLKAAPVAYTPVWKPKPLVPLYEEIVPAEPPRPLVTCRMCGIERDTGIVDCMVCGSHEVK